jgi:hypothetical protein
VQSTVRHDVDFSLMNNTVVISNSLLRARDRRASAILKTVVIALLSPCAVADAARETPEARIFSLVSPSVVGVNMGDPHSNSVGEGSGVVIGAGQVITTCQVAGKGENGHVVHSGKHYEATLQSAQPDLDLCLLNVPRLQGSAATLGTALNVKTGQHIYAIGIPVDRIRSNRS